MKGPLWSELIGESSTSLLLFGTAYGFTSSDKERTMSRNILHGLATFRLVAEKRNFRAAADELGVSKPAVSRTISELERSLGVELLRRSWKGADLTEAGEVFLNQISPALDQVLAGMADIDKCVRKLKRR
jgi:DNA-binding MarR family transcriptional regulator